MSKKSFFIGFASGIVLTLVALFVSKRVRDASIYASKKYRSSFYS